MSSISKIRQQKKAFDDVRNIHHLSKILAIEDHLLQLWSLQPQYKVYKIPKKNGDWRLIEDPETRLKNILRKLNLHLQAAYYYQRPDAVYGFCISASNEEERNIVSNAKKHIGQAFMMNIDLKDFFHSIRWQKVWEIFDKNFQSLENETIKTLCSLCCYHGRLPMGSPTSPVLSNFAMLDLDHELMQFSKVANITYTRFADDLTFSCQQNISSADQIFIRNTIRRYFEINPEKDKVFLPRQTKIVTGIVIGEDDIFLPENYLQQVVLEIERFRQTMQVEARYQTGMSYKKLKLFEQELRGKLNFAAMVMPQNETIDQLENAVTEAMSPKENFESIDWLEIPYSFY